MNCRCKGKCKTILCVFLFFYPFYFFNDTKQPVTYGFSRTASPHHTTLQCNAFAVWPLTRLPSRKSCPVIPTWCSSARPPPSARRSRTPDRPSSSSSRSCAEVNTHSFLLLQLLPHTASPPPPFFFFHPSSVSQETLLMKRLPVCGRVASFSVSSLLCLNVPIQQTVDVQRPSIGLAAVQIHLIVSNTSQMCLLIFRNVIWSFIQDFYLLCFLPSRVATDLQAYLLGAGKKNKNKKSINRHYDLANYKSIQRLKK